MGHGTKSSEGAQQFRELVAMYGKTCSHMVTGGFIELADPEMTEEMNDLLAQDLEEIVVVPVILLPAGHLKDDGPRLVLHARSRSKTKITYASELGIQPQLLAIIADRIHQAQVIPTEEAPAVLLVGRGSSDVDANSDLYKIARLLSEVHSLGQVQPAFVSLASPSVAEGLSTLVTLGASSIVVAPYFLFQGVLLDRIEEQAFHWSSQNHVIVQVAREMGPDHRVLQALDYRVNEAFGSTVRTSCDLCLYRGGLTPIHRH